MKRAMHIIVVVGSLFILMSWFNSCGDYYGPPVDVSKQAISKEAVKHIGSYVIVSMNIYKSMSSGNYGGLIDAVWQFISAWDSQQDIRLNQILALCNMINYQISDGVRREYTANINSEMEDYQIYIDPTIASSAKRSIGDINSDFNRDIDKAADFISTTWSLRNDINAKTRIMDAALIGYSYLPAVSQLMIIKKIMGSTQTLTDSAQYKLSKAVEAARYLVGYCDSTQCHEGLIARAEFLNKVACVSTPDEPCEYCSESDAKCKLSTYNEAKTRDGSFWKEANASLEAFYAACSSCSDLYRGMTKDNLELGPNNPMNYYFVLSNYNGANENGTSKAYNIFVDIDMNGPEDWVLIDNSGISIPYKIPLTSTGFKIYDPNGSVVVSKCMIEKDGYYYLVNGSGMKYSCRAVIPSPMSGKYRLELKPDRVYHNVSFRFSEAGGLIMPTSVPIEVFAGNWCLYRSCPVGINNVWYSSYFVILHPGGSIADNTDTGTGTCYSGAGCNVYINVVGGKGNETIKFRPYGQSGTPTNFPTASEAVANTVGRTLLMSGHFTAFFIEINSTGEVPPKFTITTTPKPK